jgi:lipid II:glycine glycyltransferase (peptidoglycan interpeptide bridge formation enzyme)
MLGAIRECRTDEEYVAWDRFVYDFPGAHYFQTYGWLKSYVPMGLAPRVLVFEVDGRIVGGVAFLTAKLPMLPYTVFIVPHGPLPSHPDAPGWLPLMERLDLICRNSHAIYAQVYPHERSEASVLLPKLEELGFAAPALFTSHDFTSVPVIVELEGKTEEEVLKSFRKRTTRYIREALRSDLTLRTDMPPGLFDRIYALLMEHAQSRGFQARPYSSLRAVWEWFSRSGWATFIQAWHGDTLVGANLVVFTGRTAYYLQGAVRRDYAEQRPAEFVHWHTIRKALELRLAQYDLVNLVPAGVEQFKRGFSPTCGSWHRPRTKIYRPMTAHAVRVAEHYLRPIIRQLARIRANQPDAAAPRYTEKRGADEAGTRHQDNDNDHGSGRPRA